ncbi:hypothetical protein [Streptomyces sp. NL15-2K]|uniref:hypothetical protein n=1 Tax=Streptomyces sp. NL15-2K TaxID=376149 RepID=UPI000FFA7441|nr:MULTISPECIES: hypothetical protein [Actinomycetes]WKX12261.1 hypothetical protein Q4V64_33955 [Kutzneria buriramensis]GCB46240.1 hypothetical protein SNL152K_3538 [Streptomyces sp. NL15-2K]
MTTTSEGSIRTNDPERLAQDASEVHRTESGRFTLGKRPAGGNADAPATVGS